MQKTINWIDVNDRLPNSNGEYLAFQSGTNKIYPVHFTKVATGGRWSFYADQTCTTDIANITYWISFNDLI